MLAVLAEFVLAATLAAVTVFATRRFHLGLAIASSVAALSVFLLINHWLIAEVGGLGVVATVLGVVVVAVPAFRSSNAEQRQRTEDRYHEGLAASAGTRTHVTPEAAALAGWPSKAGARVVETRLVGPTTAEVVIDTIPSRPVTVRCERIDSGWVWTADVDL